VAPRGPLRASDFRQTLGNPDSSAPHANAKVPAGIPVRGPISPEEALFGLHGNKFGYGNLTPVDMDSVPNNDSAGLVSRSPQADGYGRPDVVPDIAKTEQPDATRPWGDGTWSKKG
jgi:hypothetical protein